MNAVGLYRFNDVEEMTGKRTKDKFNAPAEEKYCCGVARVLPTSRPKPVGRSRCDVAYTSDR